MEVTKEFLETLREILNLDDSLIEELKKVGGPGFEPLLKEAERYADSMMKESRPKDIDSSFLNKNQKALRTGLINNALRQMLCQGIDNFEKKLDKEQVP